MCVCVLLLFLIPGIISSLKSNHGTIDNGIFFDMNVALAVSCELKVGSRVEYLGYKHSATDHIKVVKIEQVVDQYWDDKQPTEQKVCIQFQIEHIIVHIKYISSDPMRQSSRNLVLESV